MQWTAKNLLKWSIDSLTKAGMDHPRRDGEILVAEALYDGGRHSVHIEPDRPVNQKEFFDCQDWIERRTSREPIHYIVGRREFWSLNFKVTPQVLIPRPETEILVEQLLKLANNDPQKKSPKILDIGTGSGNIAVTVAKEITGCCITAVDICEEVLTVAQENAKANQVDDQIRFLRSDLFETVQRENLGPFDFIVSNPPYIDTNRIEYLMPDVKDFEPRLALDGGSEGLKFYLDIIPNAGGFLNDQGWLILEIDVDQADAVSRLIEETGEFEKSAVHPDYSGYPRVVSARKKSYG